MRGNFDWMVFSKIVSVKIYKSYQRAEFLVSLLFHCSLMQDAVASKFTLTERCGGCRISRSVLRTRLRFDETAQEQVSAPSEPSFERACCICDNNDEHPVHN